ncbi:hypothetical protein HOLleu_02166 [Holothuria leucospilota]|uniref:Uncharacterized protein n=1 Tax=Holothuria leucospilota TaxID=206669 RepID=A0A9Q1CQX0_HOLLE|nr:hypothetical protein HOLleu_02166 [Holothuria leucospilota]
MGDSICLLPLPTSRVPCRLWQLPCIWSRDQGSKNKVRIQSPRHNLLKKGERIGNTVSRSYDIINIQGCD